MELKRYLLAGGLSTVLLLAACGDEEDTSAEANVDEETSETDENNTNTNFDDKDQTSVDSKDINEYITEYEFEPVEPNKDIQELALDSSNEKRNGSFNFDHYYDDDEYNEIILKHLDGYKNNEELVELEEKITEIEEKGQITQEEIDDILKPYVELHNNLNDTFNKKNYDKNIPEHLLPIHENYENGMSIITESVNGLADYYQDRVGEKLNQEELDSILEIYEANFEVFEKYMDRGDELKTQINDAYDEDAMQDHELLNDEEDLQENDESADDQIELSNIRNRSTLETVIYGNDYSEEEKVQAYNNAVENGVIPQGNVMQGYASDAYESSLRVESGEEESVYDQSNDAEESDWVKGQIEWHNATEAEKEEIRKSDAEKHGYEYDPDDYE